MSSQVGFPTGIRYEGLKLMLGAEVCKGIETTIKKHTSTSFFGLKEKFESQKFCDFYSQYTKDLALGLKQLTPTQKKAYEVIWKKAISLFNENDHFKKIAPVIMEAEHIRDLTKSKIIQVSSIGTLQGAILDEPDVSHICDAKYFNLWV